MPSARSIKRAARWRRKLEERKTRRAAEAAKLDAMEGLLLDAAARAIPCSALLYIPNQGKVFTCDSNEGHVGKHWNRAARLHWSG